MIVVFCKLCALVRLLIRLYVVELNARTSVHMLKVNVINKFVVNGFIKRLELHCE